MLNEPYPESANAALEAGEGVKRGGLKPELWETVGLSSYIHGSRTSYLRTRAPVFRSTVAWLKKSRVTSESLSFLDAEPLTKASTRASSSGVPRAGVNWRGAPRKGWEMVKEERWDAAIAGGRWQVGGR